MVVYWRLKLELRPLEQRHNTIDHVKLQSLSSSNWFWSFLAGIMAVGQSSAQTYDFQNFTVENGLSQSQVVSLYQDEEGELWMGTNSGGINRYNGTNFSYRTVM